MNQRSNILFQLIASLLIAILLLPTAVQWAHSLEHEHVERCGINKTHLHEQVADCSLHDFHFSSYDLSFEVTIAFFSSEVVVQQLDSYENQLFTSFSNFNYRRGPPSMVS